jgi:hypothetical protein
VLLALPFLGLFLAAPLWLLPGIADLAANMLSSNAMPRGIMSYHSVALVPVLTVASIYGLRRLAARLADNTVRRCTGYVLCSTLVLWYFFSPLPLPGGSNAWAPKHLRGTPDPVLVRVREVLGEQASVSAQANIAAHLSQRRQIYPFPERVGTSDAVVLWLDTPNSNPAPHSPGLIGTTDHHLQMMPADYLATVDCLLRDRNYGAILWEAPWLVLRRGAATETDCRPVLARLHQLRRAWGITEREYGAAIRTCCNRE